MADAHIIKLIMTVPLKSMDQNFTLYRVITLPELLARDKYAIYVTNYEYLGLHSNLRDYALLTETQYSHCFKNKVVICQENIMIQNTQSLSCEGSLYFQKKDNRHLCQRRLIPQRQTPTLRFYQNHWVYFFPEQRLVMIRCPS
jgi:hypothetical protein